jgi:orotidine-5'-phosphate decarboxylase
LLDAKRGDIGNTARQYATALTDAGLGADAITVNPLLGRDSIEPFLQQSDEGVFVLGRTSNSGGSDLQDLELASGEQLYERIVDMAAEWNDTGNVGLVVGATNPDELESIRDRVPEIPFLVPGVGAQGGDAEAAVEYGLADGVGLVNSSRGIIFAGEDTDNFFEAAGSAAMQLKRRLNEFR